MCEIYGVKITNNLENHIFQNLLKILPAEKQNKLNKFLYFEDAQRGLVADLLIRFIMVEKGITNSDCKFSVNDFGKPFLKNFPNIEFNLSHSEEWVVCAIDETSVGIDVEAVRPIDLQVAEHFFSKKECDYIFSSSELKESRFYEVWTLKESYIKAIGRGLTVPLDSFSVVHTNSICQLELESGKLENMFYFEQLTLDPGYKLAICTQNNNSPSKVTLVHLNDIVRRLIKTDNIL